LEEAASYRGVEILDTQRQGDGIFVESEGA
jgi:hypothetical protein